MTLDSPQVVVVKTPFPSDRLTQLESLQYSREGLVVSVSSQHWNAKVVFEQTYGFRVLDELDLTGFWSQCSLADGWLLEVTSGGWKALELMRPDFLSGRNEWVREYLIIGLNECVSVLTKEALKVVSEASPNPTLQPMI